MTLQDRLESLFALRRSAYDSTRINPDYFTLLARLGHAPEQLQAQLPPVIHVAGTNGKGSTIAFMRAMAEAAGYSVHVYTSPHLLRFNERIVLNGRMIDDASLESLIVEVTEKAAGLNLHFLELTPAIAFTAFARQKADLLLLETGLGGRLDQTNILPAPLLNVITTLSFDHTAYLGDQIEQIAAEKAGIMRRGVPCLTGPQLYPAALATLRAHAAALGAPLLAPEDWPPLPGDLPHPTLHGAHQIENAALAAAAMLTQNALRVDADSIRAGIQNAVWPARLQRIALPDISPEWELWLDGGHNDSAGLVLARQARDWAAQDGKPLHIVTGMMGNKNPDALARALAPFAASVHTIAIPGHAESCIPAPALAALWQQAGANAAPALWPDIINTLIKKEKPGRILLTGSLYLAEAVL